VKVRFTPRARQRVKFIKRWWQENRPVAPNLFDEELTRATELLAVTPRMGLIYRTKDGVVTYRLLLPKTE
jgi:plasmid stabilization system protein ParE